MQQEETIEFDANEFYEILMSMQIKQKLKPFVRQFKKKDMPFIYQTIINILQILNNKKQVPLMKFNALMATKLFFDTGEYVPITLIEIYILPIIYEIALYKVQTRSQEGLTLYFIEKGYDTTKQMKRLGFNYVLLAVEFLFMSAQVKPYRNLQNQELQQESNYAKLAKILTGKGCRPIQSYKFYIPSYVKTIRKRFMKKLSRFNAQTYVDFFLKLTCDEINLNKKPEIDLKKMMAFGDAYYTIPLMNICEEELCNMQTNFQNKKKYLALIGQFMKAGDIYAVFILSRSPFLEQIFDHLEKIKGQSGIQAGDKIYPQVQAAKIDKRQFYIQFLKNIEVWAYCHPVDEQGEPTDAKKIFDILKTQRKFVFPPNILLEKIRTEMEINLKANQNRNEKMIRLVDDINSSRSKKRTISMKQSLYSSRTSKKSDKFRQKSLLQSYIQFDEVEQMVINAKKKLDEICQKQKLAKTMMSLQRFKRFWQAMQHKNQIDAEQTDDIEMILEQGTLCLKIVDMVLPIYYLYSKGAITFQEYQDKVNLLLKTDNISVSSSEQASIDEHINFIQEVSSGKQESIGPSIQARIKESKASRQYFFGSSASNLQSKTSFKIQPSKLSSFQDQQNHYNDYDMQFKKQLKNNKKTHFKKSEQRVQEEYLNSSLRSSRSSNRSSKKILQRRNNSNSLIKQSDTRYQYKDIVGIAQNQKFQQKIKKQYEPKQSFISSQQSQIQKNQFQIKQQSQSLKSQSKQSQFYRESRQIKPSIQDYYGNHEYQLQYGSQNSLVKFNSSNNSSRINLKSSSKKSVSRSKLKPRNKIPDSNSEQSFGNSFQIQQASWSGSGSLPRQTNKFPRRNQENGVSLTSNKKKLLKKQSKEQEPHISLRYKLQQSQIREPDLQPQLHSFHQFQQDQQQLLTIPSKVTGFKDCFSVNNEIILPKQSKIKLFNNNNPKGKVVNFIQTVYSKTPKNSSIVDMLSQKNAKQCIKSYHNERMKIRQAQTQSQKAKSIESFNKNMRMKLVLRKQQQNKLIPIKGAQNNQSQPVSFYQESDCSRQKSQTHLQLGMKTISKQFLAEPPKARIINTSIYNHFFPSKTDSKLQKCLMKSKSLLMKTDQFQFGYVCTKKHHNLQITLFITPLKDKIQNVNLIPSNDQNVNIKMSSNYIECIRVNTQEIVTLDVSIDNVPFVLPSLNFKFKKNKKYSLNNMLITLPCSFNKFFDFHKFSGQIPRHLKPTHNLNHDKIQIQPFKYSARLLHPDKISQTLNNFALAEQHRNSSLYQSQIYFKGKIFLLDLMLTTRGTMELSGVNMTGDHKNTKYLQFLLITLHYIFHSSHKSK